jgi:lysophospholipase
MDLLDLPNNPVPQGTTSGEIVTADGVRLRTARWRHVATQRLGTVCLLHGRSESIEKYFEVVTDLRRRGFWVATFDWRGQGGSARSLANGRHGHVEDYADYDRDFEAFMQQVVLPDCPPPYFVLAHSTGALVALRAARARNTSFERMVLCAPLLGIAPRRIPGWGQKIAAALGVALGLSDMRLPGLERYSADVMPYPGNLLTSDPVRYARYAEILKARPDLAVGAPTFGWLHATLKATKAAADPDFGPSIHVPVLILGAGQDQVVSNMAIAKLAQELRAGAYIVVPGARHEIMNERDAIREQFWAAFDAFIPGTRIPTEAAMAIRR